MRKRSSVMTVPGAFADSHASRACWHPGAFRRDLTEQPVHAGLLGEPLVRWRARDGRSRANSDPCLHGALRCLSAGSAAMRSYARTTAAVTAPAGAGGHSTGRAGGGERSMGYLFASQPVAADRCPGYVIIGRNCNLDQSAQVIEDFGDSICGQGQVVVESQRPEQVPSGLAAGTAPEIRRGGGCLPKACVLGVDTGGAIGLSDDGARLDRAGPAPGKRHD
jgi:hypothetical protein